VSDTDHTGSVFFGVLLALLAFHWATEPGESTEKTYWIDKEGKPEFSQEYSADRSSGTVAVALRIPGHSASYFRHKDCTVVTARDWSCDEGLESTDGKVTDQIPESDPRIRSVSVFRWWLARAFGGSRKSTTAKQP
jgi:hypothetical protein